MKDETVLSEFSVSSDDGLAVNSSEEDRPGMILETGILSVPNKMWVGSESLPAAGDNDFGLRLCSAAGPVAFDNLAAETTSVAIKATTDVVGLNCWVAALPLGVSN